MHIPHHSHNGRRSAPQCGLLAGDFHHRTSRISSLPTSRTYPAPFFSIFNPNMTFAHHWTCLHTAAMNPFILPCSLNVASCLPIESPPITIFFCPAGFPHSAHCIFQFPHTFDLFPSTLHFSLHSHFSIPARAYLTTLFAYLSAGFSEIIGQICRKLRESRNHLFSHTQDWVGDTAV